MRQGKAATICTCSAIYFTICPCHPRAVRGGPSDLAGPRFRNVLPTAGRPRHQGPRVDRRGLIACSKKAWNARPRDKWPNGGSVAPARVPPLRGHGVRAAVGRGNPGGTPLAEARGRSPDGDLGARVNDTVRERAQLYEAIAPVRRAAGLAAGRSPTLARQLEAASRMLRSQLRHTFSSELNAHSGAALGCPRTRAPRCARGGHLVRDLGPPAEAVPAIRQRCSRSCGTPRIRRSRHEADRSCDTDRWRSFAHPKNGSRISPASTSSPTTCMSPPYRHRDEGKAVEDDVATQGPLHRRGTG